jgi:hypothetical protein
MHYLRALRGIGGRLAFNSDVRRKCLSEDAPVISLGADGLGLERQTFSRARRLFVAIGTVEPRKNPGSMLRAFRQLWEDGISAPLVVAGRISPDAEDARTFFAQHAATGF